MFKLNLHRKVLIAFIGLALLPLALLALYAGQHLSFMESFLREKTTEALDAQVARALKLRSEMVAKDVDDFLRAVEEDVRDLALLPPRPDLYKQFSRQHRRSVWYRTGTDENPEERREKVPLYAELAWVDPDGQERLRIVGGQVVDELRDVSDPANTTYQSENYFQIARDMPPDVVYTTSLTGWHVSKAEQLDGASSPEKVVERARYQGVIRFIKTVYDEEGSMLGMVVVSLDHRHLMEFTQHIAPTEDRSVVFPLHDSGNYAFMFDNEGWIITHPRYWNIRGVDRSGQLVPPYTAASAPELVQKGIIPINLYYAGFVDPNYPAVARAVLEGRGGVMDITTEDGIKKIIAFAPVYYFGAGQGSSWIFGGIIIATDVQQFHKPAIKTSRVIRQEITDFIGSSWIVIVVTTVIVVFVAYRLSQSITGPLLQLTAGTRKMAKGNLKTRVTVDSTDEVGDLALSFNAMARELDERRLRLLQTLKALRRSRREILQERNFKETVFENIETGVLTLDGSRTVTSVNTPACQILGTEQEAGKCPLEDFLGDWPEIFAAIEDAPRDAVQEHWSTYVPLERQGRGLTFRIALLPLSYGDEGSCILAVEDLTERVNMRKQMARMERLASLGRLAAGVAHEIRNPLTGVNLLLDDLHDRLLANPADQALIQKALGEIERLEELVGELLNFASLPQPRLQPGNLGDVLQDTLFLVRRQCQKCGVSLEEDLPSSFPTCDLDPDKLKQAFLNLFNNALDAMPQGGNLFVGADIMQEGVQIQIRDTGRGIPQENIPLIFEPFYTSKGHGTGLGLSITHSIISNHGGRIEVRSQSGRGTSMLLWFPLSHSMQRGR